jgi:hypothetical protein
MHAARVANKNILLRGIEKDLQQIMLAIGLFRTRLPGIVHFAGVQIRF